MSELLAPLYNRLLEGSLCVLLDACRDAVQPLSDVGPTHAGHGPSPTLDLIVVFAAAPSSPALEDPELPNSYFTNALVDHLRKAGNSQDIIKLLGSVQAAVCRVSGGKQMPWVTGKASEHAVHILPSAWPGDVVDWAGQEPELSVGGRVQWTFHRLTAPLIRITSLLVVPPRSKV